MMISNTKRGWLYILLLISLAGTSCVSQKEVTYFQANPAEKDMQSINFQHKNTTKLQSGDILAIMVSSLSPDASAMFNPYQFYAGSNLAQQTVQTTAPNPATGYLVDEDGLITIPLIGKLKVLGLSTKEATELITEKLNKYLEQPTVNIRILNYKISVLGEVNRPAVFTLPNEQITLPEAIAMAGDLTIYGKRDNVLLIRKVDGERVFTHIDMTRRDLFNSPYYYLQANDVIYVEPTKSKITSRDRTVQLAPMVLSGLSLLAVLLINLAK